ncbi:ligase-associated DNA damage response DEXH box helicase [Winogradskyella bathintestinalis]|uniref:Ligase-associated DNA damage response DEXH box helicase n=1 Tax=Winogradskyella bathintestinalis TaxID=3035208 RepID=A0ABT7ZWA8_9FLAO|nr:ligase-associated DNA damage response DEXH box helicase [Winogradskyella bathintestinalis]MDN3493252.1 ligase-associated DNA damage response DEXH box helicase [Winogradskyella bathintestinalis]
MSKFNESIGLQIVENWMAEKGQKPFPFQSQTWQRYSNGFSGMVVAPTGFGKTFSVFLAVVIDYLNHPENYPKGLKLLWISPLRSLAKDLAKAMTEAVDAIGLDWSVQVRNGDTPTSIRRKQERLMPDILLTTPETMHLMFSQKKNKRFFKGVKCVAIDEWHELLGNKRGVLTELAISQLRYYSPKLQIWGITATIGNLEEAKEVLLPYADLKITQIKAKERKKIDIVSVLPDEIEVLPWAGHLGAKMVDKILPIIDANTTTLIFTNTRGQSELWYQLLLNANPELAGVMAIHHGSIDKKLRNWIEDSISSGYLKAVVCTSSLDLGVDFKPVDCVIQIGSAKGIARFMQRAGRSGHSPYERSKIYFVPTHSLELVEVSALKTAVKENQIESREPMVLAFDVLIQFMVTLAVGQGFDSEKLFQRILEVHAFHYITEDDWRWCLHFITKGGKTLSSYEEFHKVLQDENGLYKVKSRRISMLHRMNIGAIVSEASMMVKYFSGGYIGMIEEFFISKLKPGDSFILAGRILELVKVKDMTALVRRSKAKKAVSPSWLGGRLPLTSNLSHFLRLKLSDALEPGRLEKELRFLNPLMMRQESHSHIPKADEFLIELIETKDGHHLFMYPFEGRLVHEVFSALMAYRISKLKPLTFTIAMNDYGFELLSDQPLPINDDNISALLSRDNLMDDVIASINASEMASRKFRDIAVIAGLVVQSQPGNRKNNKSLQSSSGLIFRVLEDYEPDNLLLRQAYAEVFNQQLEEVRLQSAFERISKSKIIIKRAKSFTPLSFPLKVDSLRGTMTNENLDKRIQRIKAQAFKID